MQLPTKSFLSIPLWCLLTMVYTAEWPVNPGSDVLWYWGNFDQPGVIEDAEGNWLRDSEARLRGHTRPNWFYGAQIQNGSLQAVDMGPSVAATLAASDPLYVEMALHPSAEESHSGLLVHLGTEGGDGVLRLFIDAGQLNLQLHNQAVVDLGAIDVSEPRHVAFALSHEQATYWLDGAQGNTVAGDFTPSDIQDADDLQLTFAGTISGDQSWPGVLETVLIANSHRDPAASAAAWRARHQARTPPSVYEVEAVLVAHAEEPSTSDLIDYDECMLASIWRIDNQRSGPPITDDEIVTWHWYQLDRSVLEQARPPAIGSRRTLRLHLVAESPQISSIQRVDAGLDPAQVLQASEYLILNEQQLAE